MDSGNINMYDTQKPSLTAARYELTAVHEIEYDKDPPIIAETKQVFHVKGAQFALDSEDIAPMHPPEFSKGNYGHVLPHLTFAKPGLLWERELKLSNGEKLPWLSLLVLRENEWPGNGEPQTGTVNQFRQKTDQSLFVPQLQDIQDDELDANCRFIEISLDHFNELMPKMDTWHYYAGARTDQTPEKKGISVINAHRFPQTPDDNKEGNQFCVYLVSLEGLEPCLEDQLDPEINRIRLMCLYHWKFTSFPDDGESFRELLEKLINSTKEDKRDNWLRYPETRLEGSEEEYLRQRLSDGYVPLNYHTISGEETLAWYRSPFVPVKDIPDIPNKEGFTLSESMIYDAEHGIFDLSWSVAMNLGRLLALADGSVAINLMKWRKQLTDFISTHYLAQKRIDPEETFEQGFRSSWAQHVTNAMDYEALQYVQTVKRHSWRRKRRSERPHPIEEIKRIMTEGEIPDFGDHLTMNDSSTDVINWTKQTTDQVAIPIANMVPLENMLPMERIRFFRSDPHWLQFFIEGAISIGVQTQFDVYVNLFIRSKVLQGINHSFGLLLRSALVSGWPALQIKGTSPNGDAGSYEPIRLQEQIMLTLFRDIPSQITITEPHEGLSFGMNDNKTITLRHITGTQTGDIVMKPDPAGGEKAVAVDIEDCIYPNGVLDTKKCIEKFVKEIPGAPSEDLWKPTYHTLQLLNGADQGCFDIPI